MQKYPNKVIKGALEGPKRVNYVQSSFLYKVMAFHYIKSVIKIYSKLNLITTTNIQTQICNTAIYTQPTTKGIQFYNKSVFKCLETAVFFILH